MSEAAKKIYMDGKTLAERVNERLAVIKMTKAELALQLGISRAATSQYLNNKYASDPTNIEKKLEEFLITSAHLVDSNEGNNDSLKMAKVPILFNSKDFINIVGLCKACQEEMGLGLIVGKSGFGKTKALRYYSKMKRVAYVECDDTMGVKDLVEEIEKAVGIPNGYGTIHKRVCGIREFFNINEGYLLIIDEADKLISRYTTKKMEILRAIIDQSDVGMVIAGEPSLESEIKTYLTRFGNRIDMFWKLNGLTKDEVKEYLKDLPVDDDAMEEIIVRATNSSTGCFRLLDRTMKNVMRVVKQNNEERITTKVIRQASDMMML